MRDDARNDEHDARYTDGNADDGLRPLHSLLLLSLGSEVRQLYEKSGG
jgi:hypothetical protein